VVKQKTLKSEISCKGVALHSGRVTSLKLKPASANHGIRVFRSDLLNGAREIDVSWKNVTDTKLATTVSNNHGAKIGTVEHLMAALAGCEIDNLLIEVDGPEIPIMDGSADPFVFLIECAGIVEQEASRKAIRILKPIAVSKDDRFLSIAPAEKFSLNFEIDFDSSVVNRQEKTFDLETSNFKSDIAKARTFGFEKDVSEMLNAGLALGGSLDNAVVIGKDRVLNKEGLRYQDEFVRHKILDCIGDLYLAGGPIIGSISASRSGHELNHQLLKAIFADKDAWRQNSL
tara:strand:- start:61 stop:921 length:861 start_codon:yes stop_codon:yes gene_type:complete